MEVAKTHLGTDELHQRHAVLVHGGRYPTAKVLDQTMIDRYLMRQLIDLSDHQAGEYLLRQAGQAKIWPTGVDLSATWVSGSRASYALSAGVPFARTLAAVRDQHGWFHGYLVREVVCFNWDVSRCDMKMGCLKEALSCIRERRMGGRGDPVRALKMAGKKKDPQPARAGGN